MLAAAIGGLAAWPVVNRLFETEDMTVWQGLGAAILGGGIALAGFIGVSALLRAPELEMLRRRRTQAR